MATPREIYEKLKALLFRDTASWKSLAAKLDAENVTLRAELVREQDAVQALRRQLHASQDTATELHLLLKDAQKRLLENKPLPPEPSPNVTLVERTASWVEEQFVKEKGIAAPSGYLRFAYGKGGMERIPLDGKYQLPETRADLEAMIAWAFDKDRPYAADSYDCENYAFYLKAAIDRGFLSNGVGLVIDWSSRPGAHAYNLAMLGDGTVLVIEPQDGKVYALEEKTSLYSLLTGIFLF